MAFDFNSVGSSHIGALLDSGFNARIKAYPAPVMPITVAFAFRPIYYGCVGYPYETHLGGGTSGTEVQSFEFGQFGPAFTQWDIVAGALPPGLSLDDPDPNDRFVNIVGTPTTAGDFTFMLAADNGEFAGEAEHLIRVRRPVQWTNIDLVPEIAAGDYTSDGIMILSGAYNWLFPTSGQVMSRIGNAFPTGAGGPGTIAIQEFFSEDIAPFLTYDHDGGLVEGVWNKATAGVAGDYALSSGGAPDPAAIIEL